MIDYSPFWETLEKSNENWYTLTNKHHLSHSTSPIKTQSGYFHENS